MPVVVAPPYTPRRDRRVRAVRSMPYGPRVNARVSACEVQSARHRVAGVGEAGSGIGNIAQADANRKIQQRRSRETGNSTSGAAVVVEGWVGAEERRRASKQRVQR